MNNLIIGEDEKNVEYYLNDILSKIDYDNENKIIYDMNTATLSDILDEVSMVSLFSSNKVIIGNDFDISKLSDNDIDYLKRYLDSGSKYGYIILIAKKVDARKASYKLFKDNFNVIDTSKTNNSDFIYRHIRDKVNANKFEISDLDIEYFISRVGNDINNINSELDKLFIYKNDEKIITMDDINKVIINNIDNVIYEFTNAVLENDTSKVISMYNNFKIQNVSFDYLIAILANNFRQVLIIKILASEGKNAYEISKEIGKKEFYVKKMLERVYGYTVSDIAKYIHKLAVIDREFKGGISNIDKLELFLLDKEN